MADDFDEAPDIDQSFEEVLDVLAESGDAAPYGYTADGRPRKRPGPKPKPKPVSELPKLERKPDEDRAPVRGKRPRLKLPKPEPEDVPAVRAGVIAKGMNKLYLRAGKIVKVMDADIGEAMISVTKKETPDDVTVGEAWEELAKANPRIRAFLLKLITGGAYTQLFMAHLPIFLAVIMKDGIRKHIPFMGIINATLTDDEPQQPGQPQPSDISQFLGGLTPDDASQMMQMANGLMEQMAGRTGNQTRPARSQVFIPVPEDGRE
jgi:hypothetical protein